MYSISYPYILYAIHYLPCTSVVSMLLAKRSVMFPLPCDYVDYESRLMQRKKRNSNLASLYIPRASSRAYAVCRVCSVCLVSASELPES